MHYLKKNTKYSILAFLVLILSVTISISTLAKTEVYPACACLHADRFSLYDNPQILSITSLKPEVQTINTNTASQDELIKVLQISGPLPQKIIALPFMSFPRTRESIILRDELGGFKDPQDLNQLPEITNLGWSEWREEEIIITTG
ncbi:MAG: helix-hairpin-helix domain-containing protein [Candidatus Atribacteria bacterium]|nr:helix-hairpin-helix domain-containing protein [Candidatus Atribacteria bacterium]